MNTNTEAEYKPTREKSSFLVFGSPQIEQEEIDEVVRCMRSGWIGTGPKVAEFEAAFRQFKDGWGHPVAVNSCTAALHVSMLAAGLRPGDEVITSAVTFCATVNAIIHSGLQPVLADIDPSTLNIDPASIKRVITRRTRAIVPVHMAGRPCDMDAICEIAQEHNLIIIEDCAHAIETMYHGKPAGSFGDFGCFSFYVTKNVITGEGGMILARTGEQAAKCKVMALHGMSKDAWKRFSDEGYKHYDVVECGFKYNMMDLQAAIGIPQLRRVEENWKRRKRVWERYMERLEGLPIQLPALPAIGTKHAYHLFTVMIDVQQCGVTRDRFLHAMTQNNIGVGVHYRSLAEHTYYMNEFGWRPEAYPNAYKVGSQTVSLPISAKLTDDDVDDVIAAIKRIVVCG